MLYTETCPAMDGATYRPGVYKMPMVRMSEWTDEMGVIPRECTSLNRFCIEMYRCEKSQLVWVSKNLGYETP